MNDNKKKLRCNFFLLLEHCLCALSRDTISWGPLIAVEFQHQKWNGLASRR